MLSLVIVMPRYFTVLTFVRICPSPTNIYIELFPTFDILNITIVRNIRNSDTDSIYKIQYLSE